MAESRTEKDIEKDAEEATIWCYKKKIRELLRNEERLSTLRVVYYILTNKKRASSNGCPLNVLLG